MKAVNKPKKSGIKIKANGIKTLKLSSNVSEFVKFLDKKKKINFFLIQNNFNSSNPYIAKWLWYYKNLFPQFLGGFKKTTYVKKN